MGYLALATAAIRAARAVAVRAARSVAVGRAIAVGRAVAAGAVAGCSCVCGRAGAVRSGGLGRICVVHVAIACGEATVRVARGNAAAERGVLYLITGSEHRVQGIHHCLAHLDRLGLGDSLSDSCSGRLHLRRDLDVRDGVHHRLNHSLRVINYLRGQVGLKDSGGSDDGSSLGDDVRELGID